MLLWILALAAAAGPDVAIEIELPWLGEVPGPDPAAARIDRVAAVLRVHGVPAVARPGCGPDPDDALTTWVGWGLAVGEPGPCEPRAIARAYRDADGPARYALGAHLVEGVLGILPDDGAVTVRLPASLLVEDQLDGLLLALRGDGASFGPPRPGAPVIGLPEPPDALPEPIEPVAPSALADVVEQAGRSDRMRSLLVWQRGRRVVEAYYNGAGPDTPANLKSVTKSLAAALVGVGLRRGWIDDLDDPVGRYLPAERLAEHPDRAAITIRQLLTMSSGLRPVPYGVVQQQEDWVDAVLAAPRDEPGAFVYDTPVLQLLSAVIEGASGRSAAEIAEAELLGPLGAHLVHWRRDGQGLPLGGNDAYLRPRDLVRLGELYRRGGRIDGQRILPRSFVRASTAVQIVPPNPRVNHDTLDVRGYGLLWWLLAIDDEPAYAALGHGGQLVVVVPDADLVVVMTSRWPSRSSAEHYQHLTAVLAALVQRIR